MFLTSVQEFAEDLHKWQEKSDLLLFLIHRQVVSRKRSIMKPYGAGYQPGKSIEKPIACIVF